MSMFTLAISCLTTFNLPWFMDLTFQVLMQYCSLQHRAYSPIAGLKLILMRREVEERLRKEGTYVYLWLIHEWQKPTHYCKAIILQLKINKLKNHSWITWKDGSWTTQVKKLVQEIFWSWSCKCGNNWQRLYTLTRKSCSTLNFEHLNISCWKC